MSKVFSKAKFREYELGIGRDRILINLATMGWANKCDGRSKADIMDAGYWVEDEWFVDVETDGINLHFRRDPLEFAVEDVETDGGFVFTLEAYSLEAAKDKLPSFLYNLSLDNLVPHCIGKTPFEIHALGFEVKQGWFEEVGNVEDEEERN